MFEKLTQSEIESLKTPTTNTTSRLKLIPQVQMIHTVL